MAKMKDHELYAIVDQAKRDAVIYQGEFVRNSEEFLEYYLGCPMGNEVEGQSQVISTDCADVVDSDMTSLTRMFLGPQELMEFMPKTGANADIIEARQKTQLVNHLIKNQKNSFKILHDWMKDALIQKVSVIKYEYCEEEIIKEREFDGLSEEEITLLLQDMPEDAEIIGQDQDENGYYLKFRLKYTDKGPKYSKIPLENFIISRNAECKDKAEVVGDCTLVPKGELISEGYDEELVKSLPSHEAEDQTNLKAIRWKAEGGQDDFENVQHWTSEEVEVSDLYVLVDYDGDGLVERRRIIMAGNKILENEKVEHVPYAIMSAVPMPDSLIGRSRVEITQQTQDIKTAVYRQILNNIYRVNNARVVLNEHDTNIDDVLVNRPNGVVRTNTDPRAAVAQLETPYVGDKALQVVQYVDSARQQSTGGITANQGLDADSLQRETATRFKGAEKAATAKIEHIARVFAETGFRELYEGMASLLSHYQNERMQVFYNGEALLIDPRFWRYDHNIRSNVGLAASSDEQLIANLGSLLQVQEQLKARGSLVVDDKKTYNLIDRMIKTMGMHTSKEFFNDPEQPIELLLAENEQLKAAVQQLQEAAQANPLAEAERIKAQAKLIEAQGKSQEKIMEMQQKERFHDDDVAIKLTEIEAENQVNVPGSLI